MFRSRLTPRNEFQSPEENGNCQMPEHAEIACWAISTYLSQNGHGCATDVVVVVEWIYYLKKLFDGLTSTIFFFDFRGNNVNFFSPMKIATFLRRNGYHPKRVVDFPQRKDTFRKKHHGNRQGF